MTKKAHLVELERFAQAIKFEKEKDFASASNLYEVIIKNNPLHVDANNRLMIIYRKLKKPLKEFKLISRAIENLERQIKSDQLKWIDQHPEMARDSRPLAKILGLLSSDGLPFLEHEALIKWRKRLRIMEARNQKGAKKAP